MKRSILKRGLLLSAATVAILTSPVRADNLDISSTIKNAVKTSSASNNSAGDITIESNGIITLTQAGAAVTLDSSNDVNMYGAISNKDTDGAQGILIDTGTNTTTPATITGNLLLLPTGSTAAIDLTGKGTGKVGIGLTGNGTLVGNVDFTSGTVSVQGNGSTGVGMSSSTTLTGNMTLNGAIQMNQTTLNENVSSGTGISAVNLAGTITGDLTLGSSSAIYVAGNGSRGVVTSGNISGAFANFGTILTRGFVTTQNQSTNAIVSPKGVGDAMAGSALAIGGSVGGGFFNNNTITMEGGLGAASPVVLVSPILQATPASITFGVYAPDTTNPGFSFYNRGTITGTTVDPNTSIAGLLVNGYGTANVTFNGSGLFNSGTIRVAGTTTKSGSSAINALALGIGFTSGDSSVVTIGATGDANSGITNTGLISAQVTGDLGGTATAIGIGQNAKVNSLNNSGTILAVADTNTPGTVQTMAAYAINDPSGSLSNITNSGTIQASATPLTSGYASQAVAAWLANNTTGVTFTNTGAVIGDVRFGAGADTLSVLGTSTVTSSVIGNIDFGSAPGATSPTPAYDMLDVGAYGLVSGQIRVAAPGMLDIKVEGLGELSVQNNSVAYGSLLVRNLTVEENGTLNIAVSTVLPGNVSVNAGTTGTININDGANLNVIYSSFLPANGQFVLLQSTTANMHISTAQFGAMKTSVDSNIPFLFNTNGGLQRITAGTNDQIVLSLTPKSSSQLGLSGYATQMFPYVNAALENDDALGAGMINGVHTNADAQAAYSQFAPDASGGTRAIAISLTDHATGPVAARQRALRLYATQPGDLTLWGQEFAQQVSDKGSDGIPGFKDSGFGFAVGADGGSAADGWYGGAFTFYTGNVDQRAPQTSRNNTQWYMLSGYSTWRGKGLFLDTQITAGFGDLSAHRFIVVGNAANNTLVARQANSKRSAALGAAGLTTGANFVFGSTTLTPNIALDGLTMREEGYTETGGGGLTGDGFDLKVNSVLMSSLRGFVGLNLRQDVNFGGFYLQPELRAGYRYDFLADRVNLTASFVGAPGAGPFTVIGPQLSKGGLLGGASVSATTGAWSIGLNYDMLSGSNGSMTQVGSLSLVGRI